MARRRSGPRCHIGKGAASIRPDRASSAAASRSRALAKRRHLLLALGDVGEPEQDGAGRIGRRRRAAADPVDPGRAGGPEREREAARRRGRRRDLAEQRFPVFLGAEPRRARRAAAATRSRPSASATRSGFLEAAVAADDERERRRGGEQGFVMTGGVDPRRGGAAAPEAANGRPDRERQPGAQIRARSRRATSGRG